MRSIGPNAPRAAAPAQRGLALGLVRPLLDALPTGVLVLDSERRTVHANPRLLALVGLGSAQPVLGRRPGELWDCVHAADGCGSTAFCDYCGAAKALLAALSGEPGIEDFSVTRAEDGRRLQLRVSTSAIELGGERLLLVAVEERADAQRRRALEHVFFHDVLNTAGTISGAAQLLALAEGEQLAALQRMIVEGSKRLTDEIVAQRDLLAAENGELVVSPASIGSLRLLRELALAYASHPVARERVLRVAADAADVELVSDRALLGRVLGNMIKNALEAEPAGGVVTLGCSATPQAVSFEVHNPRPMAAEVQMQLFDRTFSTKGPHRGLGTYGMKLLAEGFLRGRVSFSSTEREGTTFRVVVPRAI